MMLRSKGKKTTKLRFTGTCSEEDFNRACAEQKWWYHSFYFDNGLELRGDYDIGRNVAEYGFPSDLTGTRVLDVGTASGWFSFYFEQLGGDVTAFDARGMCDYDIYGEHRIRSIEDEKPVPDVIEDGESIYLGPVSRGFWIMRGLLNSPIKLVGGSIYDLGHKCLVGEQFDLVFLGAILLHVRDPIGALMAARRVCRGKVIATTTVVPDTSGSGIPWMRLPATDRPENAWWRPSPDCFRRWFLAAGFSSVERVGRVELSADKVIAEHHNLDQPIDLIVASI